MIALFRRLFSKAPPPQVPAKDPMDNFVVLRKIAENPGIDVSWLRLHLTLSDTRVLEVVNKLMFEGYIEEMATDLLVATSKGLDLLEKL